MGSVCTHTGVCMGLVLVYVHTGVYGVYEALKCAYTHWQTYGLVGLGPRWVGVGLGMG